jgi:hypothetical protein
MVLLSRKAKINRVKAALPGLLLDFQNNPPPRRQPFDEPSQLDRLGITKAWQDCCSATVPDFAASSVCASANVRTIAAANARQRLRCGCGD